VGNTTLSNVAPRPSMIVPPAMAPECSSSANTQCVQSIAPGTHQRRADLGGTLAPVSKGLSFDIVSWLTCLDTPIHVGSVTRPVAEKFTGACAITLEWLRRRIVLGCSASPHSSPYHQASCAPVAEQPHILTIDCVHGPAAECWCRLLVFNSPRTALELSPTLGDGRGQAAAA
jgi:hypothetical protein